MRGYIYPLRVKKISLYWFPGQQPLRNFFNGFMDQLLCSQQSQAVVQPLLDQERHHPHHFLVAIV